MQLARETVVSRVGRLGKYTERAAARSATDVIAKEFVRTSRTDSRVEPTDVMVGTPLFKSAPIVDKPLEGNTTFVSSKSPENRFVFAGRRIPNVLAVVTQNSAGKVVERFGMRESDLKEDITVVAEMYARLAALNTADARAKYGKETDCVVGPSIPTAVASYVVDQEFDMALLAALVRQSPRPAERSQVLLPIPEPEQLVREPTLPYGRGMTAPPRIKAPTTDVMTSKPMFEVDHTAELDALVDEINAAMDNEPTRPIYTLPPFVDDDTVTTASLRTIPLAPRAIVSSSYDPDAVRTIPSMRVPRELARFDVFNSFTPQHVGRMPMLQLPPPEVAKPVKAKEPNKLVRWLKSFDNVVTDALLRVGDSVVEAVAKIAGTLDGIHRSPSRMTTKETARRPNRFDFN